MADDSKRQTPLTEAEAIDACLGLETEVERLTTEMLRQGTEVSPNAIITSCIFFWKSPDIHDMKQEILRVKSDRPQGVYFYELVYNPQDFSWLSLYGERFMSLRLKPDVNPEYYTRNKRRYKSPNGWYITFKAQTRVLRP